MRYLTGLLALAAPITAHAQTAPAPSAQGDVAVTIYSDGTALVQDTRRLNLPAGVARQEFPDVSENIRPETVRLTADGVTIVEQNFDYDLLSPNALLEKAVGQTVTIVRTNPGTGAETREQARVLAYNQGVVLDIGGRIEVLRDDGLPVRVIFPGIPPNLRARPTLSVTLDAERGGTRPVTLAYLTRGLTWRADYVALFDEAKQAIDVQGWITLNNSGATAFANADTLLVAGMPSREEAGRPQPRRQGMAPGTIAGTETADRARLGDYYLYPLENRTTIAANQQKQVSFLDVSAVPAKRGYRFRNDWMRGEDEAVSAESVLSFSSSRDGGLGDALPAGTVRVYMRDASGQPQFIGENGIGHTPMGSQLALKTGEAFDIKVQPIVANRARIASAEWLRTYRYRISDSSGETRTVTEERSVTYWRTDMRYVLTNASPAPVTVELVQAGLDNYWRDTRVPTESQPGSQRNADERVWQVTVPANGETVLTASFDTRY